ncbi:MAG TPA: hypothetical protein VEC14_06910, partial [Reyranellaceae bacterium]|nr:hypothetical protein [Reyranellaceae bacterium]
MPEENQPVVVSSLRVALIHNNDATRLAHIRPALAGLAAALAIPVTSTELVDQPPVAPQSWPLFLRRRLMAWRLQRAWRRYRGQPPLLPFLEWLRLPRDLWRNANRRQGAIENILSGKHITAWRDFLGTASDCLLVAEDDTVFRADSVAGLKDALALLDERPTYIDLAGGFTPAQLQVDALEAGRHGRFREYLRPVTNTTGAYLLNRPLARLLVDLIDRHPDWNGHTADWMI